MAFHWGRGKNIAELVKHSVIAMIEPGAEIEGKMRIASGTARLNSHFKGEIQGEGTLIVLERGEVEADINVKSIVITGKVKGSIHVTDRIEIKERGIVLGDVYTPVLVVEPGGYLDGQCHMPAQGTETPKIAGVQDQPREL
jgi:cytoskeletal protein CcmA (bactofilin family)